MDHFIPIRRADDVDIDPAAANGELIEQEPHEVLELRPALVRLDLVRE
jgi:hypothetical protein